MEYVYKTRGTCSREIRLQLDGDIIRDVQVIGGCNGNLKGIAALVKGMKAENVIARCSGIRCGLKTTSCPDQLAKALTEALQKQK
ncbi:MAG: TIGR03905 family TSCPD domain-containing protein [Oscillospiraceae bacterium]|jgi:uncharacterized protein (TIGR03905 family)|nr:TIGR03905 family TSCPD domain-containing protein [Oscillospiraceae bacterium]